MYVYIDSLFFVYINVKQQLSPKVILLKIRRGDSAGEIQKEELKVNKDYKNALYRTKVFVSKPTQGGQLVPKQSTFFVLC